jgi:hypothetical protein
MLFSYWIVIKRNPEIPAEPFPSSIIYAKNGTASWAQVVGKGIDERLLLPG